MKTLFILPLEQKTLLASVQAALGRQNFTRSEDNGIFTYTARDGEGESFCVSRMFLKKEDPLAEKDVTSFDLVVCASNYDSMDAVAPVVVKLSEKYGCDKMAVAVTNAASILQIDANDYCDPVVTLNELTMNADKTLRETYSLADSIPIFFLETNCSADHMNSYHFPDFLRVLRGKPLRRGWQGTPILYLHKQKASQAYLAKLLFTKIKSKKMQSIWQQLQARGVDTHDFIELTKEKLSILGVKGMAAAKIKGQQNALRAVLKNLDAAPVMEWDIYETLAYFEAKGDSLTEIAYQLKDFGVTGSELLDTDFEDVLAETTHGEEANSLRNMICSNTFRRFVALSENYVENQATQIQENPQIQEELKERKSVEPSTGKDEIMERVEEEEVESKPVEPKMKEEYVLVEAPKAPADPTIGTSQQYPSGSGAGPKSSIQTQEINGILLQLTYDEPTEYVQTSLRSVVYNVQDKVYHVSFQDQKYCATSQVGYEQPYQAARVMNMLCREKVVNPDVGSYIKCCNSRDWAYKLPTSSSIIDQSVRKAMWSLHVKLKGDKEGTPIFADDLRFLMELYLDSSDKSIGEAVAKVFKARDAFRNGVNSSQLRSCLSHLAVAFDMGSSEIVKDKGKWEDWKVVNDVDLMQRLKELPENMVIERNLAKYDNDRVVDRNLYKMQNTEELSSQELSDFKSVSNFDLFNDESFDSLGKEALLVGVMHKIREFRRDKVLQNVELWRRQNLEEIGNFEKLQYLCILNKADDFVKAIRNQAKRLDSKTIDEDGNNLLHICAIFGRGNIATYILNHFPSSDWFQKNSHGLTPLHLACIFGHSQIVEDLVLAKCPVEELYKDDYDALYLAAYTRHCDVIEVFHRSYNNSLKSGVPLKISLISCGERKWTALDLAVARKDVQMMEYLLKNFDVNVKSPILGKTAFARAAENATQKEDVPVVRAFYSRMVLRPKDSDGNPLWGKSKTGVDINTQDHNGMTPLMWLAKNNQCDLVREILYFGADVSLKDNEGRTAYNHTPSGCSEVSKTLEDAASNPNFKNRIYYRLITKKGITLYETRNMKVPTQRMLNKLSVVECLFENDKKAHVKYYDYFGWIPTGSPENKNPLVRPDATLMTFERFLENESRFTPKELRDMDYFKDLRKEYIKKFTPRGLPLPDPIPSEAIEVWQEEQKKEKKSPMEKYILTKEEMMELSIIDNEFENRRPYPKREEWDYSKLPDAVFIHAHRVPNNNIAVALSYFDREKPVVVEPNVNKITPEMLETIEACIHQDTIIVAWDVKECLELLCRKHYKLIDVNNLYKNYRKKDVEFHGSTRLQLKEVAALILSERLSENSNIEDYMYVVQKLMSLYICTNVEEERIEKRKNEPEEPDVLAINGWRTKQDLIEAKIKALRKLYGHILNSYRTDPLTGINVVRVHVKKVEHLNNIEQALKDLEDPKVENIEISRVSIAVSMKTKSQKKGFFVYLMLKNEQDAKRTIDYFQGKNRLDLAFKAEKAQGKSSDSKKGSVRDSNSSIRGSTNSGLTLKSRGTEKSKHGLNPSAPVYDAMRGFNPMPSRSQQYDPYMQSQSNQYYPPRYPMYGDRYPTMMPHQYPQSSQPSQSPKLPIIQKAESLRYRGNYRESLQAYQEAIKKHPKHKNFGEWHMDVGEMLLVDMSQPSAAQKYLDVASRTSDRLKACVEYLKDMVKDFSKPSYSSKPSYTHHDDMDYSFMNSGYGDYNPYGDRLRDYPLKYPEAPHRSGRLGPTQPPQQNQSFLYRSEPLQRSSRAEASSPQPPTLNKAAKV